MFGSWQKNIWCRRSDSTPNQIAMLRFDQIFTCNIVLQLLYCVQCVSAENNTNKIIIGAVPASGDAEFKALWSPTFEAYLNNKIGNTSTPPVSFSLVILNLSTAFNAVQKHEIDFIFINPSLYSCLDLEYSGVHTCVKDMRSWVILIAGALQYLLWPHFAISWEQDSPRTLVESFLPEPTIPAWMCLKISKGQLLKHLRSF